MNDQERAVLEASVELRILERATWLAIKIAAEAVNGTETYSPDPAEWRKKAILAGAAEHEARKRLEQARKVLEGYTFGAPL